MKKCYLSGPISGKTLAQAECDFIRAHYRMFMRGYSVVNPLRNGLPRWATWWLHMVVDCVMLAMCDAVAMLPEWQTSRGARIERNLAKLLDKKVFYINDDIG